jgi:hypothetical protein
VFSAKGTGQVKERISSVNYALASEFDIGTAPNDIPLNQYLGTAAFQDAEDFVAVNLDATTLSATTLSATTITEGTSPVVTQFDIGTAPDKVPLNQYLGSMAFTTATNYNTNASPNVISVNSSSNALRITQTGSGNALLVEDSANPDATPFVVDASGNTVIGYSVNANFSGDKFNVVGDGGAANVIFARVQDNSNPPTLSFVKSRGASIASAAIVQVNDNLGTIYFKGNDGSGGLPVIGAQFTAAVDGTPGTNDMPGRLVFSTTRDGASSPTEAMRIDSNQNIGIGGAVVAGRNIYLPKAVSGSTNAFNFYTDSTIASDVTNIARMFATFPTTQAAAFTLADLTHFEASQNTFGAGSAVTSQHGFRATANLIGATNNYGFYSNIASGTGRWNFYANGTADNYFAGNTGIGAGTVAARLHVRQDQDGTTRTIIQNRNATGTPISQIAFITGAYDIGDNRYAYIESAGGASTYISFGTGNGSAPVEKLRIDAAGGVLVTAANGTLGYGTGAGGAITQTTSRTQGVSMDRASGAITLVSAAGTTTWQSFTVTNPRVAATDTIIVNQKSGTDLYMIHVTAVAAGSFRITFATTGGTTTEQPVFNFAVIKAVTA